MKKLAFALFSLIFLFSASVFAQTTEPTPPQTVEDEVLKISTNLIQVDVTVTDKDGKIVTDLKPEDFEVYQNKQKQDITNFSFISSQQPPKPAESVNLSSASKNKNLLPLPPVKLKAEQVRHTYALVIDDNGLSFANIYWVRKAIEKFINEQMQEGDLVAILRTSGGIGALQSFTSDKRQLFAAVDKIKWNSQSRGGIDSFLPIQESLKGEPAGKSLNGSTIKGIEEERNSQQQIDEIRNNIFVSGTLNSLNDFAKGMSEMPGRKAIMFFSEGFSLKNEYGSAVIRDLKKVADTANRSSAIIYPIDPRGLHVVGMFYAADDVRSTFPGSRGETDRASRDKGYIDSQDVLFYLAAETGGLAYVDQNDINAGIQRAIDDQSGYYLLGYQPDAETFDLQKNKYNNLEIKLKRPGLKIRYHSGFFPFADRKPETIAQTPQRRVINAMLSPFSKNDIYLSLYPVYQNDAAEGDMIQALLYIDAKDLQFKQLADNRREANIDVVAMTFAASGAPVQQISKSYAVNVSDRIYQNMMTNGFVYTLPVPVKNYGAYQFRVAVRDSNTEKLGSASQFIEIPNFNKKMSLSNIILDSFTPEEWQKIKLGGGDSEKSALIDTSLRQFKSGTVLRYDYIINNPKRSRQITSQLRLIYDGKVIYEENPVSFKTEGQLDLMRMPSSGAVVLGKNLVDGNYILQIIVTDQTAKMKSQTTAQYVEFEIIK